MRLKLEEADQRFTIVEMAIFELILSKVLHLFLSDRGKSVLLRMNCVIKQDEKSCWRLKRLF